MDAAEATGNETKNSEKQAMYSSIIASFNDKLLRKHKTLDTITKRKAIPSRNNDML